MIGNTLQGFGQALATQQKQAAVNYLLNQPSPINQRVVDAYRNSQLDGFLNQFLGRAPKSSINV